MYIELDFFFLSSTILVTDLNWIRTKTAKLDILTNWLLRNPEVHYRPIPKPVIGPYVKQELSNLHDRPPLWNKW